MSLEQAREAREKLDDAYADCVATLKQTARYDYKSDWLPTYSWVSDGEAILIKGRDADLQNGFGAYAGVAISASGVRNGKVLYADADAE